jgi:hypothetical protein
VFENATPEPDRDAWRNDAHPCKEVDQDPGANHVNVKRRPICRRYTFLLQENVMFKIFIDGNDDRLRLEDLAGRQVGWIRGHTLGFGGLASEKAALRAAVGAWGALDKLLHRTYPRRMRRPAHESNVRLLHDGAYEWIADGFRPIARLLRPRTERNSEDSFALELLVPSYATQHVTIAAAQVVWEALSDFIPARTEDVSRPAFTSNQKFESATLAVGGR